MILGINKTKKCVLENGEKNHKCHKKYGLINDI